MPDPKRDIFYARLAKSPIAASGFFETIEAHFRPHNDVEVYFTGSGASDMRLAATLDNGKKKPTRRVFATMAWQPRNRAVFARTKLSPSEMKALGFSGAVSPKSPTEPQKSEVRLGEDIWRLGAREFIRALEGARQKLVA